MATTSDRLNARQTDGALKAIKTSKLIKRLQDHALGEKDSNLTSVQMRCCEILLRKSLPDLKATELTGEGGGPILLQDFNFPED